jgi:hypothetical protein
LITNQTYLTTERVELTLTCLKLYLIFMTVWKRFLKDMLHLIMPYYANFKLS